MADDLNDFFDNLFEKGPDPLPEPSPDEERLEAITVTNIHMDAFREASAHGGDGYHEMLPDWLDELKYFLPILEQYEEYEQCQKVFDTMRAIREDHGNIVVNKSLEELDVPVIYEDESQRPEDPSDATAEPDF